MPRKSGSTTCQQVKRWPILDIKKAVLTPPSTGSTTLATKRARNARRSDTVGDSKGHVPIIDQTAARHPLLHARRLLSTHADSHLRHECRPGGLRYRDSAPRVGSERV